MEDHQGSHADHKVRMLLHPLLLTTNLSVSGSVALVLPHVLVLVLVLVLVMPHVLVLVRCRASISRVQSKA